MNKNARVAFNALKKIGVPVVDRQEDGCHFIISAEMNDDKVWADYYDGHFYQGFEFGVNPDITAILNMHGLYAEWVNPGYLVVFDS